MIFVTATCALYYFFLKSQNVINNDKNACHANLVLKEKKLKAMIKLEMTVNKKEGTLYFEGPVHENDKEIEFLQRRVNFKINNVAKIKKSRGAVFYAGMDVLVMSKDNISKSIAEILFPPFFIIEKETIYLDFFDMKNGVLFIKDNVPFFYCRNV